MHISSTNRVFYVILSLYSGDPHLENEIAKKFAYKTSPKSNILV